jgi:hypothetical protein
LVDGFVDGHVLSLLVAVLSPVGGHTHTLGTVGTRGSDGPTVFCMADLDALPKLHIFQFVIIMKKVDVKATVVAKNFFDTKVTPMVG